eukprot:5014034-Prymnesium_polylepis.3
MASALRVVTAITIYSIQRQAHHVHARNTPFARMRRAASCGCSSDLKACLVVRSSCGVCK